MPCLVGDAYSGKTSLFFPIHGLVHHGNIATVPKQRAFNKAMIFIDEATEKTLDIDDWKVLSQGGYTAHDVKYQTTKAFINKCPMLITPQHKLDFGPVNQPAMERPLRTYNFKHLARTKKKAVAWLKKHAMDCVVWAAEKAKACKGDSESENDDDDDASSETGAGDEERHRQVRHMLRDKGRKRSVQENFNKQQHLQRIDFLREKGVSTQNTELLPTDPWKATPTPIRRDLQKHQEAQRGVQNLLQQASEMISPIPERIVWCYSQWQPAYIQMLVTIPQIELSRVFLLHWKTNPISMSTNRT